MGRQCLGARSARGCRWRCRGDSRARTMISDTISVSTYRIWGGIRRLHQGEHVLQTRSLRLALTLGQASLARAKVAQSGRRTVARTHFLVTIGVNGHHESMDAILVLDQVRGAPPGRSERRFATRPPQLKQARLSKSSAGCGQSRVECSPPQFPQRLGRTTPGVCVRGGVDGLPLERCPGAGPAGRAVVLILPRKPPVFAANRISI